MNADRASSVQDRTEFGRVADQASQMYAHADLIQDLAEFRRVAEDIDHLHAMRGVPVTARALWLRACCQLAPDVRPWVVAIRGTGSRRVQAACLLVQRTSDSGVVEVT